MITIELRQYITKTSFVAIKAAFGVQERLTLYGYRNAVYDDGAVKSGTFYFNAASGEFYRVTLGPNGVTGLRKGKVNVSFD